MRILCLVTDAFGGQGGIARFNQDFLTSLSTYDNVTEVVVLPRRIVEDHYQLPPKITYLTTANGHKIKFIYSTLCTVFSNPLFDVVICGHINLLPIAFLIQLKTHSLVYLVIHGIDAWQPNPSFWVNRLVGRIDGLISVSNLTKKRFISWSKLNALPTYIFPCTVDTGRFTLGTKKKELVYRYGLENKRLILTLARLEAKERYKGFDVILEILPSLLNKIANVVYMIAGDGSDRPRLLRKTQDLGLTNHVIFTGYLPEAEKVDHYHLADVYAMPSMGEGFGIVFLEAMACGLPVVGSLWDGGREALRDGMLGKLVDPGNPSEVEHAIIESLKIKERRVPKGLDYFTYPKFEQRCHGLLDQLCRAKN